MAANLTLTPAERQLLNVENSTYQVSVTGTFEIVGIISAALAGLAITSTFQAWQLRLLCASVITGGVGCACSVWRTTMMSKSREVAVEKPMERAQQVISTLYNEYATKLKNAHSYREIHNAYRAYFLKKLQDPGISEIGEKYAIKDAENLSPQQQLIVRIVKMVWKVFWKGDIPTVAEPPNHYSVDASLGSGSESEKLMREAERIFAFRVTALAVAAILLCGLPNFSVTTSFRLSSSVVAVVGIVMRFVPFVPMPYENAYLATLEHVRQLHQVIDDLEPYVERLVFTASGEVDAKASYANCRAIFEARIDSLEGDREVIEEVKQFLFEGESWSHFLDSCH